MLFIRRPLTSSTVPSGPAPTGTFRILVCSVAVLDAALVRPVSLFVERFRRLRFIRPGLRWLHLWLRLDRLGESFHRPHAFRSPCRSVDTHSTLSFSLRSCRSDASKQQYCCQ